MKRPPRSLEEPLFSRQTIVYSLLQGTSVLVMVLAVYLIAMFRGLGEAEMRALSFTTLVVANLGLILTNRSWSRSVLSMFRMPNAALKWILGGAIMFLAIVLYVPFVKDLFHFSTLHFIDLVICLMAGIISILWFEGFKIWRRSS
jgi:Ca2+-transporting ATPase